VILAREGDEEIAVTRIAVEREESVDECAVARLFASSVLVPC